MWLKWLFDRFVALIGLIFLSPVLLVVAVLVAVKTPGGPVIFSQKRVGKDGKLFTIRKFRTMAANHGGSSVSVAGESRITTLGAKLRHYKLDELPENYLASVLYGVRGDFIAGPAVLLRRKGPELIGWTKAAADRICADLYSMRQEYYWGRVDLG